jgi:hypothetical protein
LLSNYYGILANTTPPDCQVKEQMSIKEETIIQISKASIKSGVLDRTIPSIIADSAATSNDRAKKDTPAFLPMG